MPEIRINRTGRLGDEPETGHNRWHPDIEPKLSVNAGDIVTLETRDAADGQIKRGMTVDDLATMQYLMDLGVDGIITNYPDRLRVVMRQRGLHLPRPLQTEN